MDPIAVAAFPDAVRSPASRDDLVELVYEESILSDPGSRPSLTRRLAWARRWKADTITRKPIYFKLAFPDDVRSTASRDRLVELVCENRSKATPGLRAADAPFSDTTPGFPKTACNAVIRDLSR
jgi:hypothetical protein